MKHGISQIIDYTSMMHILPKFHNDLRRIEVLAVLIMVSWIAHVQVFSKSRADIYLTSMA